MRIDSLAAVSRAATRSNFSILGKESVCKEFADGVLHM
jgi:hypothetical protein